MNVAAKLRVEKEKHPERFCPKPKCLWRTDTRDGFKPCGYHTPPTEDQNDEPLPVSKN